LETTDDRQTLYRQQLRAYEASRNCLQYENILFFLLTSFLLILHSWLARFEVADLSGIARWYLMQPWCFAILLGTLEFLGFLSSPSACRTSRASKNRFWPHENGDN
jgi:hypothetical protein